MKCFVCDRGTFTPGKGPTVIKFRDREYTLELEGEVCSNCDYFLTEGNAIPDVMRRLADEYRKQEGLLTSEEIRSLRMGLSMSQAEFADHIKVGVASIKRWEGGQIQERSMDELIRLKANPDYARRSMESLASKTIIFSNSVVGLCVSNPEPYAKKHDYLDTDMSGIECPLYELALVA